MNEEEQIKDEVIRHIDEIVQKAIEVKYRDEEMLILQTIIKELQKELDKKDKVIKLAINWIGDRCFYSDDCGNSCEIIQDSCFNPIKDCEECIKEYFYKKAEKENE